MTGNVIEQIMVTVKAIQERFPNYPLCLEPVEDGGRIIGIGIFNVPESDFNAVHDYCYDLESTMMPTGWEILPLIRNPETTKKHYPQMLRKI